MTAVTKADPPWGNKKYCMDSNEVAASAVHFETHFFTVAGKRKRGKTRTIRVLNNVLVFFRIRALPRTPFSQMNPARKRDIRKIIPHDSCL